ncbi:hypothetical protein L6164_026729 [Bauhinia variegata]|uniref:Uncharacterized protein n=1 Tax=Bauhinia variegata TaxID=167791 RepID=A0ACB9LSH4_BAUVA|nr:hypothetical protein L6164_026729 [Bauhinia variegata]
MSDSFNAFKLHCPSSDSNLSPTASRITALSSIIPLPNCFKHHQLEERTNAGFHVQSQQSSRWTPTPAQLLVLEELYRQGKVSPTAEQIQQITLQLRRFGKIEAKNVFYWFQNHKARDRQKRRRREMQKTTAEDAEEYNMGSSEKQEADAAGLGGTGYEVKETKKSASSNCSRLADESASLDIAEREANGWTRFKERETLVLRRNTAEREAKCQNKQMPCLSPYHLKDISTSTAKSEAAHRRPNPQLLPLELFPLKRDDQEENSPFKSKSRFCASASVDSEITSNQFFEFLPLKNLRN